MSKTVRVIRKGPNGEKIQDIQVNIWENILRGTTLPAGVTYELAPSEVAVSSEVVNLIDDETDNTAPVETKVEESPKEEKPKGKRRGRKPKNNNNDGEDISSK